VTVSDLGDVLEGERLLVKTSNSARGIETFYEDFVALDGDATDFLAEKNLIIHLSPVRLYKNYIHHQHK
jgi:hypothetical protein